MGHLRRERALCVCVDEGIVGVLDSTGAPSLSGEGRGGRVGWV